MKIEILLTMSESLSIAELITSSPTSETTNRTLSHDEYTGTVTILCRRWATLPPPSQSPYFWWLDLNDSFFA